MSKSGVRFVDVSNSEYRANNKWPAIIIPKAEIDGEVERMADEPRPSHGRRGTKVVHPMAGSALGLAPGMDVTIHVLKPGEDTAPIRHNSSQVSMCIRGSGVATIGSREIPFGQYDVWNTPSMAVYRYRNDGDDLQVRLTYSNQPMLELLEVHYVEEDPVSEVVAEAAAKSTPTVRARDFADDIELEGTSARLRGYEFLVDPDIVPYEPLIWRWEDVSRQLDRVAHLGDNYTGRRLYLLYHPATQGRNGTAPNFFATIAKYPAGIVDQPHRHASAAINYYFAGNGRSTVAGEKFVWEAGDLMLSAPGWAVHNHGARDQGFCALTIQDHPLHIAMDSLVWQETLKSPIVSLGSQMGWQTNRADLIAAQR